MKRKIEFVRNVGISGCFLFTLFLLMYFLRRDILSNHVYSFLAAAFFGFGTRCDRNKALARRTAAYQ